MNTKLVIKEQIIFPMKGVLQLFVKNALTGEPIIEPIKCNVVVDMAKYALVRGVTDAAGTGHIIDHIKFGSDFTDAWSSGTGTVTTNGGDNRILDLSGGNFTTIFAQPAWVTTTPYTTVSVVSNGGILYRCIAAHTSGASSEPGVGANWELFWIMVKIYVKVAGDTRLVLSYSTTQVIMDEALSTPAIGAAWDFVNNGDSVFTPQAASASYDQTSMDVLFDSSIPAYAFTYNYNPLAPEVQVITNIIGDDVLAQNIGVDSVNFVSAALHTGNGEVFSYVRFPKIGISGLINVTVVWTLSYP